MNFTNTTIEDFIEIIRKYEDIQEILNLSDDVREQGFIYERLWDICIKFGCCELFTNQQYKHLIGNVNEGKLHELKSYHTFLNGKVISGNSGGCSDITLQNRDDETYIFISSKYPKEEKDSQAKSVDYYDIQNIISMIDANKEIYQKFKIYLVVPNRTSVLEKVKNANKTSKYITKYMTESYILDKDDLQKAYTKFLFELKRVESKDYSEYFLHKKKSLKMRFHQELLTNMVQKIIMMNEKNALLGCKCRSGKTYMTGGLIVKEFSRKGKLNVMIITPAPTETAPQFTDELFHAFREFEDFKIHWIQGSRMLSDMKLGENNIIVTSKQLLQKYTGKDKIKKIYDLDLDMIIFDENHFTGTTDISKDIVKSYSSEETTRIYLTATFNKTLREWGIPTHCQFYWDIEDEQICKKIMNDPVHIQSLVTKQGDDVITIIEYFQSQGMTIQDIFESYLNMPDMFMMTNMFYGDVYQQLLEKTEKSKYGFCFENLFALNKKKNKFIHDTEVKLFLRYLSGSNKEVDFPEGDYSFFGRMKRHCSETESRRPFTQIWFLPSNNIHEISTCLEKCMKEDSILQRYNVFCVNRKNEALAKEIKDDIFLEEKKAIVQKKDGLILLAGNMLTLGITLDNCDVVILMNNTLSCDKVLQQMYRCMTEDRDGEKRYGFVIDLNMSRVLNTCIQYSTTKNDSNPEDKIKYLIENHLINIDLDMMYLKKLDTNRIVKKLMDIWKSDPINSFKSLLRNLESSFEDFDNDTQRLINRYFANSIKGDHVTTSVLLKDEDDEEQTLKKGREYIQEEGESSEEPDTPPPEEEKEEIPISFTKDVLPFIIPLICILTIKDGNKDILKMLSDVKTNPQLLEIFDEMCFTWWNKKGLIDLVKNIVSKHFNKSSITYSISIQFKMSLQSLIDRPKELLELINDCLKPKNIEKKKFGEVFTNMTLVNEMLDKLPEDVWTNKDLKWLDPSNGMGNFPIAVYLRLMETLKEEIPENESRKKHILENMLYMCELNKKNVLITQQIFDIENKYELHLHNGDYLQFKPQEVFDVDDFDIILSNPPYQEDGATGDNKLYLSFIRHAFTMLKEDGYLLFITPPNVKNYLTCQNKNRDYINDFHEIQYLSLNTSNKYFPKVGSTFAYFLIRNRIVDKCDTKIEFLRNHKVESSIIEITKGFNLPLCASHYDIDIMNKTSNLLEERHEVFEIQKASYENDKGKLTLQRIRKEHFTKGAVSKTKTKDFKYKIIDKCTMKNPFPGEFYYNKKPMIDFGEPKLIMTTGGYLCPSYDEEGEYNLSDNMIYMLCPNKKYFEAFKIIIESDLVNYLNQITMTDGLHGRDTVIMNLKKIDLSKIKSEDDIYTLYGIRKDERIIIEKTLGKKISTSEEDDDDRLFSNEDNMLFSGSSNELPKKTEVESISSKESKKSTSSTEKKDKKSSRASTPKKEIDEVDQFIEDLQLDLDNFHLEEVGSDNIIPKKTKKLPKKKN